MSEVPEDYKKRKLLFFFFFFIIIRDLIHFFAMN